jgi:hypothetical protein
MDPRVKTSTKILGTTAVAAVAWLTWAAVTPPPVAEIVRSNIELPFPVVRGAYHIHSLQSDGTGSLAEIGRAADTAGLQFVIITDHGDATRLPREPRYYSKVLCVDGVEISTADGHYAAVGLGQAPYPLAGEGRDVVEDVARLGGFGIAAHPDSAKHDLQWREWDAPFPGIEWFNGDSQWRDEPRWRLPAVFVRYLRRPAESVASLFDRPESVLARWDQLSQRRKMVALAGHDAHQRLGLRTGAEPAEARLYLKAPSYTQVFRAFTTSVELDTPLLEQAAIDGPALVRGVRAGRVYTTIDAVAGPAQFAFYGASGTWTARMGDSIPLVGPIVLHMRSNAPAGRTVTLFRNGTPVFRSREATFDWFGDRPGVYRVEIALPAAPGHPQVPWLVSNAIAIGMSYPVPDRPVVRDALVWPALKWRVEKSDGASATASAPPVADGPGLAIEYQLGKPGGASPFVAVSTFDVVRLSGVRHISFRARADRPMRASLQLRSNNNHDDERWRRSFYADATPRTIVMPVDALVPVVAGVAPHPAWEKVGAMMFVIDTTNTLAGTSGTLVIDQFKTGQ